ncbi:MAG: hypothetical protein KDC34_05295 [Saprospiraceae bacterium]|nr:hypothetical protein [Saprospiraceae bacterium]
MRKSGIWILFATLLFFSFSGNAQVQVRARLDSTQITIGDQVRLRLELSSAEQIRILDYEWPGIDTMEQLEILHETPWDTLTEPQGTLYRKDFTLVAWDSGYYQLPKIRIPYNFKGTRQYAQTNTFLLQVRTLESDSASLAPIKPIISTPSAGVDIKKLLLLLGGVLVLIALIFAWRRWMQAPVGEEEAVPEVIRPAHEVALEKLDALELLQLYQQGEEKEYQSRLTHILREYVEGRFGVPALEQTTDQIIRDIEKLGIGADRLAVLKKLLPMADLVKFAKAKPPAAFHEMAMTDVREWVENTIPVAPVNQNEEEE